MRSFVSPVRRAAQPAGRALLLAAVLAATGASAFAQSPQVASPDGSPVAASSAQRADRGPGGPGGPAVHGGMHRRGPRHDGPPDAATMQRHLDARLAELRQKLQITPAQQPAWDSFATTLRTPPARMAEWADPARRDAMRAEMQRLTTPERIDRMRALRAEHNAEADRRGDAVKAFYATLTPAQQRVFDAERPWEGPRGAEGRFGPGGPRGPRPPEDARRGPPPAP